MNSIPDLALRPRWLARAERLKPELRHSMVAPVGPVRMLADPAAFQGWRAAASDAAATQAEYVLSPGQAVILDFGQHLVGRLLLHAKTQHGVADSPLRLRFLFGEVPAEIAEEDVALVVNQSLSWNWRQEENVTLDSLPAELRLPRRYAFRYVRIEVVDRAPNARGARLSQIRCETESAVPVQLPPSPAGLPPDLRKIDEVSIRTLRDCMQTVFEDGPKRDRRLWLGDLRLQALANAGTYDLLPLVERCLCLFAGLARDDGTVMACLYEKPEPVAGADFILDYAMLFAPTLMDYLEAGGDLELAREFWPLTLRQLHRPLRCVDEHGLFQVDETCWNFIDWKEGLDKQVPLHGALLYCLARTVALAERLGYRADVANLQSWRDRLTSAARAAFLNPADGLLRSGQTRQLSWASQAWGTLGGILTATEAANAFRRLPELPEAVRPAGPYLYHYVLEAMFSSGLDAEAVALLRYYWGGMVRAGADTFWEIYDPAQPRLSPYRNHLINSYCHAWSCTPAYFFRRYAKAFTG